MEQIKKNYHIFELDDHFEYKYMVLKLFSHNKVTQNAMINEELKTLGYEGWILFDNLLNGGNISTRFVKHYFERELDTDSYFALLEDDYKYRKLTATYLKETKAANGSVLPDFEIKAINNGEVI